MAYHDGSRSWAYSVREHRVSASLVGLAAILHASRNVAASRSPASAATTAPPAVLFPANGAYFGAWVAPRGAESAPGDRASRDPGRRTFAIDHQYYRWDTEFPTVRVVDRSQGRIPFVELEAEALQRQHRPWTQIASGAQDAMIIARAQAVKAFGYRCTSRSTTSPRTTSRPTARRRTTSRRSVTS